VKGSRQRRIRPVLRLRAALLAAVRSFFSAGGYLEVETPCRIPAPAPEAHIDPVASGDWYLQTSPELCMKRLLAAGYDRIFQICRCFRGGERGRRHLPEMTLLEWYTAGAAYGDMMDQCQDLLASAAGRVRETLRWSYRGHPVDLSPPYERLPVAEAFRRHGSIGMDEALETGRFDACVGLEIAPRLGFGRPVFLVDYPTAAAALARRQPGNPSRAERFELYICGLELCNGFSELTDPVEQRRRFEEELRHRERNARPRTPMPEPFLSCLGRMPEAAGNAMGIDRLVMLLADVEEIDDVVAFTPEEL
jgi:lysyl-tRNA synthetase class 2